MIVKVNQDIFKKLPDLKIVLLHFSNIDNKTRIKESKHLLDEIEKLTKLTFNKDTVKTHNLISPWEVAREEFGEKAKHYHTSVERLLNDVIKNKSVLSKDVTTNLFKYMLLKHLVPGGIDDPNLISGSITFTVSKGKEKASILKTLKAGDLYYKDNQNILGTKLDYWKNNKTALNPDSKSALIHFEILPPLSKKKEDLLIKETTNLIKTFCNAKVKKYVLDKKKRSVKI